MGRAEFAAANLSAAFAAFSAYVLGCLAAGWPLPSLAWLELWGLGLAAMTALGASKWTYERPWGVALAGAVGGLGTVGGLMCQIPLVRSVAGFALTVAYWTGAERFHIYGPVMDVSEVRRRALWLSLAMLIMNAVSYLFLHA